MESLNLPSAVERVAVGRDDGSEKNANVNMKWTRDEAQHPTLLSSMLHWVFLNPFWTVSISLAEIYLSSYAPKLLQI